MKSLKIAAVTAYAPRESFKFNSAPRFVKLYFGNERKKERKKKGKKNIDESYFDFLLLMRFSETFRSVFKTCFYDVSAYLAYSHVMYTIEF